jgi:DNA mismatch repair protein MutS2
MGAPRRAHEPRLSRAVRLDGGGMQHAIERLELGAIRAALLLRAHTPLGAAEVNSLEPLPTLAAARERIEAVRQARALLDLGEAPPVWGAEDVAAALELGVKGVMLEGPQLRAIAETMRAGSAVRRHLLQHEHTAPLLYGLAAGLVDLSRVAADVTRCFAPDGQLADDASRELGPLRQRVRALRESVHQRLGELITELEQDDLLQDRYYTVRGDRYVLPIKASFKNEVRGIVHDASGSGQTVYIEPQAIIDLGNRLKIAQSEQLEEEHRILSRLTVLVAAEADEVQAMMGAIARVDLLLACARLATDLRCIPVVPDERPGFELVRARHPLLLLQALAPSPVAAEETPVGPRPRLEVVPNDLGLKAGQRVLVLTGPNTGGKTVAMKTIGLFALMARAGLHLPCAETSRIGWYEHVAVAIGDQQSIASNLSTFAAHVKELVGVLASADARTLVLIDEIAADTDPAQGQALAQAILERLAEIGAHVVVTTHFELLKAVPFVDPRFRNAGVGFDPQRMRPTYRVSLDVPQSSSGFDVARTLGLAEDVVERARTLTAPGTLALQSLITRIEERSSELDAARAAAERAAAEAAVERDRLAKKRRELDEELRALRDKAQVELMTEIRRAREEVRQVVASLQAVTEREPVRDAMRSANAAAEQLARFEEEQSKRLPPPPKQERAERVKVGDWVHVAKLGRDGEVAQLDDKEATVVVGTMRVRVPVVGLLAATSPRPKAAPRSGRERRAAPETGPQREASVVTEQVDVRGYDVEESISRLEAFLDHHYGTPTTHVRVIHGLGTGALRDALREHLRRSGYVRAFRPGDMKEGGDGVTVVSLA